MFEKFKSVEEQNILVIGDIILDKYIHGQSTRISPEAPVPIVLSQDISYVLGGAANVAANLTSLGANAFLMGFVGKDDNGDLLANMIESAIGSNGGVIRSGKITTTKTRIVSKGQQMLRVDEENTSEISDKEEKSFFAAIEKAISTQNITGIILQDYNKGLFTKSLIKSIISIAEASGIPYYVDPKHKNFWEYEGAAIFKPNFSEIKKANYIDGLVELNELMVESAKKLKCDILMCTLADEGIAYIENGKVVRTSTQKIDVVDVSGAGDSALSIIVLCHLLGYETKKISILANLCGRVVCMKSGVSTITIQELKDAFYSVGEDNAK